MGSKYFKFAVLHTQPSDELLRRSKRKRETMTNDRPKEKKTRKYKKKLSLKERIHNESPINEFLVNEVVLCTIPGYSPWPARIKDINSQTIFVEFFGTGQI